MELDSSESAGGLRGEGVASEGKSSRSASGSRFQEALSESLAMRQGKRDGAIDAPSSEEQNEELDQELGLGLEEPIKQDVEACYADVLNGRAIFPEEFITEIDALCLHQACNGVLRHLYSDVVTWAHDYGVPVSVLTSVVEDTFLFNLKGVEPPPAEHYTGDLARHYEFYQARLRRQRRRVFLELSSKYSEPAITALLKKGLGLDTQKTFP